ncbi:MAG TPA: NADH-quinone oxidoreductase subunit J [Lacipirellulaceae bacterium]|jgi:NADH-quinone oxidoreductase subunit J|nr:NADH-quinone oxidoreductase subunit J [Lacipirellulaceae bacterium]
MQWFVDHWPGIAALALMGGGVWWMMPRRANWPKVIGLVAALIGAFLLASRIRAAEGPVGETILFSVFATAAITCAILMITNRNPVYSALWFALVTLSTCGLFWLQYAPFLAAATVTVYAGAIVVTFVFVIMLAQQSGSTAYDQRSRQPFLATLAAFVLLGLLLNTLRQATPEDFQVAAQQAPVANANLLSRPPEKALIDEDTMTGLGRSLFGDYLFAVELAGTILLVATIGAIAIAPRRSRGTL